MTHWAEYICPFIFGIYKMTLKPFKNTDEQIQILKDRNLLFLDEEIAKNNLRRYGYYEIINGYKKPFLVPEKDEVAFKDGTTFEHIYALYDFDKSLRSVVLEALEDFEQYFKASIAYAVSDIISDDQNKYLAKYHYNTGRTRGKKSERDKMLKGFKDIITKSNVQPFVHYRKNFHNIPPWILTKGMSFGNSIYWFRLSKPKIRNAVISSMLITDAFSVETNNLEIKQFFGDILNLYLGYRNAAAHNGRIYNYRSNKHLLRHSTYIYNKKGIDISKSDFDKGICRSSLGVVLYSLMSFKNPNPAIKLNAGLEVYLKNYLKKYPQDREFILKSMELNKLDFLLKSLNIS